MSDVFTSGSGANLYQATRAIALAAGCSATLYIAARAVSVLRSRGDAKAKAQRGAAQYPVLLFSFLGSLLGCVVWIDVVAVEGIFSLNSSHVISYTSLLCLLLAAARTLHCFITIHSRFHPPSKKVAFALAVLTLVLVLSLAVSFVFLGFGHYALASAISAASYAVFVLFLLAGTFLYAVSVLAPPSDPLVARAQTPAEIESRRQLLLIMRGLQVLGTVAVGVSIANAITPQGLAALCLTFVTSLIAWTAASQLARLMSRQEKTAPRPHSPQITSNASSVKVKIRPSLVAIRVQPSTPPTAPSPAASTHMDGPDAKTPTPSADHEHEHEHEHDNEPV